MTNRKLSNTEVAEALGMHHSYVSRMRTGERLASIGTISRISQVYGVPTSELVAAVVAAEAGDPTSWVELLDRAFVEQPKKQLLA